MEGNARRRSRHSLKTRWVLVVVAVPLILLASCLLYVWFALNEIERIKEEMRDRGEPVEFADLAPPELPPEENASPYMQKAASAVSVWDPKDTRAKFDPFVSLNAKQREALKASLPSASPVLQILRQASWIKHSRRDINYSIEYWDDFVLPSYQGYLSSMRYVQSNACIAITDGRVDDAYNDVALLIRMAYWTGDENPFLVNAKLSEIIAGHAATTLTTLWGFEPPDAMHRRAIEEEIQRYRERDFTAEGFKADRVITLMPVRNRWKFRQKKTLLERMLDPIMLPWDLHRKMSAQKGWSRLLAFSSEPTYKIRAEFGSVENSDDDHWTRLSAEDKVLNYRTHYGYRDRCYAQLDLAIIALHLEDFREMNGRYPASLKDIPDLPTINPYNGATYQLLPKGDTYVLHAFPAEVLDASGYPDAAKIDLIEEPFLWDASRKSQPK